MGYCAVSSKHEHTSFFHGPPNQFHLGLQSKGKIEVLDFGKSESPYRKRLSGES